MAGDPASASTAPATVSGERLSRYHCLVPLAGGTGGKGESLQRPASQETGHAKGNKTRRV